MALFFFPDENQKNEASVLNNDGLSNTAVEELTSALEEIGYDEETPPVASDDEFCILEDTPGTGIRVGPSTIVIKWVKIQDFISDIPYDLSNLFITF